MLLLWVLLHFGEQPGGIILRLPEDAFAVIAEPIARILFIGKRLLVQIGELASFLEVGHKSLVGEFRPDVAVLQFFLFDAEMAFAVYHDLASSHRVLLAID